MKSAIKSRILSLSSAFPDKIVTNDDLAKFVDTSDQWISERTGIRARRVLADGEQNSDIATKAAQIAIERAGIKLDEIDLILRNEHDAEDAFQATFLVLIRRAGERV